MTVKEFKATLSQKEIDDMTDLVVKMKHGNFQTPYTEKEKDIFLNFIRKSSEALGEDLIAEPLRYITASMSGLRIEDFEHLIGEDFDPAKFKEWNEMFGAKVLDTRRLPDDFGIYDIPPLMRNLLHKDIDPKVLRSCAADMAYYLLEHKPVGDYLRNTQTLHLLLDAGESATAAEYISQAEGTPLLICTKLLAKAMDTAPDSVKQATWDMLRAEGEKINHPKLLQLMLNDCLISITDPDRVKPILDKLHSLIQEMIAAGHIELSPALGIAKLRMTQNSQMQRDEEGAKAGFQDSMSYLVPPLQKADPLTVTEPQLRQYWNCIKILQEMVQPKAIILLFELVANVEKAQMADEGRSEKERTRIEELLLAQYIDMSRMYYNMPAPAQEQFNNYSATAVDALKTYFEAQKAKEDTMTPEEKYRQAGYYQAYGELAYRIERYEESNDALTEAQILQMRKLAELQKNDGVMDMSEEQLTCRLNLAATNHMIATNYYRDKKKSKHDRGVLLRSNMNIADDCFRFYPHDQRVIHLLVNAALELGDHQHNERGLLAECNTYEKAINKFRQLNEMNLPQHTAVDFAIILCKCGQCQADATIRRYKDAINNLETGLRLWNSLAENTKNPSYRENANAVKELLKQLKGNK